LEFVAPLGTDAGFVTFRPAYLPTASLRGHAAPHLAHAESNAAWRVADAGEDYMAETKISFLSAGRKLSRTVRRPGRREPGERRPAWIVMHGFGSNSSSSNVLEPCAMFEKLGYVTLRFDMPGCGESEGERGNLICLEQVQAASDALTFLAKNSNVDGGRI